MNCAAQFAPRAAHMQRSAVREFLKLASQPGMISFAGGLPAPDLFPVEAVQGAAQAVLARLGPSALQYSESEGIPELRDWIAARFSTSTLSVAREHILITHGAQQALQLIGQVFIEAGDRVAVENPTYLALLSAWRPLGAEFVPVPADADGMQVARLEESTERRPKLVYTQPNFQN